MKKHQLEITIIEHEGKYYFSLEDFTKILRLLNNGILPDVPPPPPPHGILPDVPPPPK